MGYESAPATAILATHCAVCSRPLLDAVSVNAGMGPTCRKRYGIPDTLDPEARAECNRLIHALALRASGLPSTVASVASVAARVAELGASALAAVLIKNFVAVHVGAPEASIWTDRSGAERTTEQIAISAPYSDDFREAMRAMRAFWNRERKCYMVPTDRKREAFQALQRCYPGAEGIGPKGPFTL